MPEATITDLAFEVARRLDAGQRKEDVIALASDTIKKQALLIERLMAQRGLSVGMPTEERQKLDLMIAALRTGHEKTARFWAQVLGFGPCPRCDYIKKGCRCPTEKTDG